MDTDKRGELTIQVIDTQVGGFLQTKVLNIIDASFSDVTQREAVKQLVKNTFKEQIDWVTGRRANQGSSEG